ncbi:MAG: biotin transporter BioY [Rhodothermales bacterium]
MSALALRSPRTASVDLLRSEDASALVQVAGIVGFALLAVLGAQVRIYLWEIPITLQTVAVYGSGLFLGWRNGLLAMGLYLLLGLFFPVFAGEGFGATYLLGALSAGYLLALPLVAAVVGAASARWNSFAGSFLSVALGSVVLFTCGVVWLHVAAGHATWAESIYKGWLLFVLWDLAKLLLVSGAYTGIRRMTA